MAADSGAGDRERPGDGPTHPIERRVAALEAELLALRSVLRGAGIVVPPSPPVPRDAAPKAGVVAPVFVRSSPPAPDLVPLATHLRDRRDDFAAPQARDDAPIAAPPPPVLAEASPRLAPVVQPNLSSREPAPPRRVEKLDLERFLGAKLAAWVGAVAVLTAVAFFLKFAYDQGWLGRLSPATRLIAAYLFAAALIAGGEIVLRRYGRAAAVGLFAAGVGSLYLATLAAAWPLDVFSPTAALAAASAVAVLGGLLTLRAKMLSVGVVSILGGLVAPLVLGVIVRPGLLPPTHLTILLAIGLALAAVAPFPFLFLRFVSVAGTALVGAIWFIAVGHQTPATAIVVAAAWWAMTTFEATAAALSGRSPRANAASMLLMTFAVATVGAVDARTPNVWTSAYSYVPLALAVFSAALAIQFGTGLDALRRVEDLDRSDAVTDDEKQLDAAARTLGLALWAQGGILFVAGLGVFLRHGALAAAWVATGVITLELARRLRSLPTAVFGFIALWLGAAVAAISSLMRTLPVPRPAIGNGWWLHLPPGWTGGFVAVVALAFVAWRWSRPSATAGDEDVLGDDYARGRDLAARLPHLAVSCGVLFTVMWMAGSALRAGPCLALTLMLVPATFFAIAFRHDRMRWPTRLAAGSLVITLAAWMFLRLPMVFGSSTVYALLAPPLALTGVLWLLAVRQTERGRQERLLVTSLAALALIVLHEIFADLLSLRSTESLRLRSDLAAAILAGLGVLALFLGRIGQWRLVLASGALLTVMASIVWCIFATLVPRAGGVFAEPLVLNATTGAGLATIIAVAIAYMRRGAYAELDQPAFAHLAAALAGLLVVLPIWLVSFVIDAILDPSRGFVDDGTPRQAALSAWWGVAALALIAIGFARRVPALRYAGLAALALVALKVLVVDMQGAGTIWRVVGMLAAGLLMVATSIVYVKVGRLLDGPAAADAEGRG